MEEYNNNLIRELHFHLTNMAYFNSNTWATEESLIEDFDIFKEDFESDILSPNTILLVKKFRVQWVAYKHTVNYAEDATLIFFDDNWHDLVKEHLLPALDSFESDLEQHGIQVLPYKKYYVPNQLPSKEEVLSRGRTLYGLLLKHKIVKKTYMK